MLREPALASCQGGPPRPDPPRGPFLVAGCGRAGEAAARRLAAAGARVALWDKSEGALGRCAGALEGRAESTADPGPALERGEIACVVKSPGISPSHPLLRRARALGVQVIDELELGWRMSEAPLVAITGTNGKSTVTHLVTSLLAGEGLRVVKAGNAEDAPPLSAVTERDLGLLVCEVSSYQLEGCPAFLPELGVFTNLTHDHLGRHRTMERYGAAKRRMFFADRRGPEASGCATAVVNVDGRFGARLAADLRGAGSRVRTFGASAAAELRVTGATWSMSSARVELRDGRTGEELALSSRLPGPHNALNLAAALLTAEEAGVERERALRSLPSLDGLPGRFERIDAGQGFDVVVDFAHTPDAVEQVLATAGRVLRERSGAPRLHVLISASGPPADDLAKRPKIGAVAGRLADTVVVTISNPRGEPAERLVSGLARGARSSGGATVVVEVSRRRAIERLMDAARPGDCVVVTGRGPLRTIQDHPGDSGRRFDDREVVREVLGG